MAKVVTADSVASSTLVFPWSQVHIIFLAFRLETLKLLLRGYPQLPFAPARRKTGKGGYQPNADSGHLDHRAGCGAFTGV
jgi:hypothetical protein